MSEMGRVRTVDCVWPIAAELGEGALWDAPAGAVWIVDIEGRAIHRFDVVSGTRSSWPAPDRVGFIVSASDGRFVVGLAKQLAVFSPADGSFAPLADIEPDLPDNRINDGTVGPDGALWFGSLQMPNTAATGSWYRWTGNGEIDRLDQGYVVTNGPAFSPDGGTQYFSDSLRRTILRRAISSDCDLGPATVFARIEDDAGYPDGLAIDADGCLWAALFAGHSLRRYDPEGRLMETIDFPCANVTKPAFGGDDLRTMYVTTARIGLSPADLSSQPLAGGLFSVRVDTPGVTIPTFRLASGS